MACVAKIQNQDLPRQPYIISRVVFCALSPLDQLAAQALEKCGIVQIVDRVDVEQVR